MFVDILYKPMMWFKESMWRLTYDPAFWLTCMTLMKIICILIAVAYFTIAESKIMASIQRRLGPNVVGFWGLLQPLADGFKLLCKELMIPMHANGRIFILAPVIILILSLLGWSVIPFQLYDSAEFYPHTEVFSKIWVSCADISYGLLFLLAISGLNVYGMMIAGWASNSKYAFLGSLRSASQMISYEVSIGLVLLPVILLSGSLNLTEIVYAQSLTSWYVFVLLPASMIFFMSMLAETNRSPFDLPEAEAELVAGYNVEYSSMIFSMFFLAEYSNMLVMSTLIVLLFFGGWLPIISSLSFMPSLLLFSFKMMMFCFLYIWVRATYPRYRYDQLMDLGWKVFLPLTLGYLIFLAGLLFAFTSLPQILEITPQLYTENMMFDYFSLMNNNNWYNMS